MEMEYVITLSVISEKYKVGTEDLVRRGIITEKAAERLERGAVKALRASSVNAICDEVGCLPGDLFALRERVDSLEEHG